ncbi:hypothetical protein JST97_02980 [bacterium]|nr:hypothetical protein [bacterium]
MAVRLIGVAIIGSAGWIYFQPDTSPSQPDGDRPPSKLEQAPLDQLDPKLEGKVVYITGRVTPSGLVRDPHFGVWVSALRLEREVREYGLGYVTEYVSERQGKTWHRRAVAKPAMVWKPAEGRRSELVSQNFYPEDVHLGPYSIPPSRFSPRSRPSKNLICPKDLKLSGAACWSGNSLYLNGRPENPQEGDLRVDFGVHAPCTVTAVGIQRGAKLLPPPGQAEIWMQDGVQPPSHSMDPQKKSAAPRERSIWALLYSLFIGLTIIRGAGEVEQRLKGQKEAPTG